MIKYPLFLLLMIMVHSTTANQTTTSWKTFQLSEQHHYETTMVCKKPPSIGKFQDCTFKIKHSGKSIENAKVFLDGGMPLHHHGLPTAPKVNWSKEDKTYAIKGLKFSMPGKWELRFHISNVENMAKDHSIFTLEIN